MKDAFIYLNEFWAIKKIFLEILLDFNYAHSMIYVRQKISRLAMRDREIDEK